VTPLHCSIFKLDLHILCILVSFRLHRYQPICWIPQECVQWHIWKQIVLMAHWHRWSTACFLKW
jgi:hypothetical protein